MLELKNVTMTVNDGDERRDILKDVSLVLEAGKVTGLFGESGSGKSTLLSVAGLLLTPSSGEVIIDGASTVNYSQGEKTRVRRENIGIIFQNANLIPSLRVLDQLLLMSSIGGVKVDDGVRQEALDILSKVGMEGCGKYYPSQLSGGQKQRVNVARALVNKPKILLADELTSALDSNNSKAVMDLIVELTGEYGMATLLITHDERYQKIVDGEYFIEDGIIGE